MVIIFFTNTRKFGSLSFSSVISTKLFKEEGKKGETNMETTCMFHCAASEGSAFIPLHDKRKCFQMQV